MASTMFCLTCDRLGVPRPVSVQNDFNFNNRVLCASTRNQYGGARAAPVERDGISRRAVRNRIVRHRAGRGGAGGVQNRFPHRPSRRIAPKRATTWASWACPTGSARGADGQVPERKVRATGPSSSRGTTSTQVPDAVPLAARRGDDAGIRQTRRGVGPGARRARAGVVPRPPLQRRRRHGHDDGPHAPRKRSGTRALPREL